MRRVVNMLTFPLCGALFIAAISCLAWYLSRGDGTIVPNVSDAEARSVLARAVAIVQAGHVDELCPAVGGDPGFCTSFQPGQPGSIERAPKQAPEVVGSRELLSPGPHQPARILRVRGVDGAGEPYESDFYVIRGPGPGGFDAPYPVYWSGLNVGD